MLALQNKQKVCKRILLFVTEYRPSVPNLKTILMSKWHLIQNQPLLREIHKDPPLLSYRKGRSLKNVLVRAKLWRSKFSYLDQQELCLACHSFLIIMTKQTTCVILWKKLVCIANMENGKWKSFRHKHKLLLYNDFVHIKAAKESDNVSPM